MSDTTRRTPNDDRHDALARLLRDADPAGARPGLDGAERARLRQTVVEAARHHAATQATAGTRPGWLKPALAAALLVAAAGLGYPLVAGRPGPSADAVAEDVPGAEVSPPPAPPALAPTSTSTFTPTPAPPPTDPTLDDRPAAATVAGTAPQPGTPEVAPTAGRAAVSFDELFDPAPRRITDQPSPPARRARTVQFVAPRGTRIIWTLAPNFASPIAGPGPGKE